MNNTFSQLDRGAQKWAVEQINRRHPLETRTSTLDILLNTYFYDHDGRIIDDSQEGQDPEYYDQILGD